MGCAIVCLALRGFKEAAPSAHKGGLKGCGAERSKRDYKIESSETKLYNHKYLKWYVLYVNNMDIINALVIE